MEVKLKNQNNKEEWYLRTRGTTQKKWPWKKGSELWKPGELQNALKVIITWRTTTALKPTYKLLVGGLGCPKKTKEIQDPTKRKYKNQKKKTPNFLTLSTYVEMVMSAAVTLDMSCEEIALWYPKQGQ